MDVKDFNPNDLQVKVVDDRVVVEGKYEKVRLCFIIIQHSFFPVTSLKKRILSVSGQS